MKKTANIKLVAQAVNVTRSNKRQGTSKVKTRAEVSLSKRKIYKQKGTGNARHGAKSAHIFVGGGVAHGPTGNANWKRSLPKTMKRQALKYALDMQAATITVVPELNDLDGKTKTAAKLLKKIAPKSKHTCIVLEQASPKLLRSLRNIEGVALVLATQLNAYQVVQADKILFTPKSRELVAVRTGNRLPSVSSLARIKSKPSKKTTAKTKTKKA